MTGFDFISGRKAEEAKEEEWSKPESSTIPPPEVLDQRERDNVVSCPEWFR